MRILLLLLAAVLALWIVLRVEARMSGPEQSVSDGINTLRTENGLTILGPNADLDRMAQDSANGCSFDVNESYLDGRAASLNGWGFVRAGQFLLAITTSPEHRAWLLKPELLQIGVGKHGDCWTVFLYWKTPTAVGMASASEDNMKKHKRLQATATPSCAVAPDPSALGDTITISGSGFPATLTPETQVTISISVRGPNGEGPQVGGQYTDADGNFSTTWTATWIGTNTVEAGLIDPATGMPIMATCTFTVTP